MATLQQLRNQQEQPRQEHISVAHIVMKSIYISVNVFNMCSSLQSPGFSDECQHEFPERFREHIRARQAQPLRRPSVHMFRVRLCFV